MYHKLGGLHWKLLIKKTRKKVLISACLIIHLSQFPPAILHLFCLFAYRHLFFLHYIICVTSFLSEMTAIYAQICITNMHHFILNYGTNCVQVIHSCIHGISAWGSISHHFLHITLQVP